MFEAVGIALVLAFAGCVAGAAVWLVGGRLRRMAGWNAVAWGGLAVVLVGVALASRIPQPMPQPADAPLRVPDEDYTASRACRACHPEQYASWHRSYHRTMTQTATPAAVVGDFDDARVRFGGERFRMFELDGTFYGEMPQPGGRPGAGAQRVTVPFRQTTGSHHMQLYWYPTGRGRALAIFPLVWLIGEQRWLPRRAAFVGPPGPRPASFGLWNRVCLECHATRSRPRLGPEEIDTQVTELGIACEACHGPGGPHVEANRSPLRRYRLHLSSDPDPTIVDPRELSHERSAQVCGQCHVTKTMFDREQTRDWSQHGSSFRPGDDLEQSVNIISKANLEERDSLQRLLAREPDLFRSLFWADGVTRVSGREYSALRESACFTRGEISCLSCHQLHKTRDDPRSLDAWAEDQLAPGMDGNAACTGCHPDFREDAALSAHTHHEPTSSGSACQDCHMPYTTYGLLKAIRDHKVASPSLAAELETGRPNACNQCHLDRSLGWTADALARWYGTPRPALTPDQERVADSLRWALEGDAGVRALAAWSMGRDTAQAVSGTGWMAPYLVELMDDPYDAVRIIARRSLRTLPAFERVEFDELAPPARRAKALEGIRREWASRAASGEARGLGPSTLFDAHGRLETGTIERLLEKRDLRPLELLE